MRSRHLALVGPTASGKSALALELAQRMPDTEIISVDSMQVYRGMDIGTAKPSEAERRLVTHHLIDLVSPLEEFTLSRFQQEARVALADIEERGKRALFVGGTGLYLQAVLDGLEIPGQYPDVRRRLEGRSSNDLHAELERLDPLAASRMEPGNRRRIERALEVTIGSGRPFSSFGPGVTAFPPTDVRIVGIWLPRDVGNQRIEARVKTMLEQGWLEEVRELQRTGLGKTAAQALGYKELLAHLAGSTALEEAVAEIVRRTRSFSRRQRVWFRRDPRIVWYGTGENPLALLPALLKDCELALSGDAGAGREMQVEEGGDHTR